MVSGLSSKATLRFPRHERMWIVTNHGTNGSEKKSLNYLLKHCQSLWYVTVWNSYHCTIRVFNIIYLFYVDYAILLVTVAILSGCIQVLIHLSSHLPKVNKLRTGKTYPVQPTTP